MNKSEKGGKGGKGGNIWTFLRDNWYVASTIFLTVVMVILIVIFMFSTPKKKQNIVANKCVDNTERYISNVAIAKGDSCPDGYYDANTTGTDPIDIQYLDNSNVKKTGYKLCYQIPEQMCSSDSIVTGITFNSTGKNSECENSDTVKCNTENKQLTLQKLSSRCINCDDTPVDYYDDKGLINIACGGVTNLDATTPNVICTSQQSFDKSVKGIKNVSLDSICNSGILVPGTNICMQK